MSLPNDTLTAVPGVRVGHAEVPGGRSGSTVVLGPFRGAVEIRGAATGTREIETLRPEHVVPVVDAVLLTGGSALGLAAAEGVAEWLEERGLGYETGVARVPIVPAAVIFDLATGSERPGRRTGYEACESATAESVREGRAGAGAGATVGTVLGERGSMRSGLGSAVARTDAAAVGALAVVNALGDVVDREGRIVAGARAEDGRFLDSFRFLRESAAEGEFGRLTSRRRLRNTTLAVIATDAPLGQVALGKVAALAVTALSRRISPVHTPFDGDVVFSLSTAEREEPVSSGEVLVLGVAAVEALEEAILRAVGGGGGGPRSDPGA